MKIIIVISILCLILIGCSPAPSVTKEINKCQIACNNLQLNYDSMDLETKTCTCKKIIMLEDN